MTQLKPTARGGRQEYSSLFFCSTLQKSFNSYDTVNGRMVNSRPEVEMIGVILQIEPSGKKDKTIIFTMWGKLHITNLAERSCAHRHEVIRLKSLN